MPRCQPSMSDRKLGRGKLGPHGCHNSANHKPALRTHTPPAMQARPMHHEHRTNTLHRDTTTVRTQTHSCKSHQIRSSLDPLPNAHHTRTRHTNTHQFAHITSKHITPNGICCEQQIEGEIRMEGGYKVNTTSECGLCICVKMLTHGELCGLKTATHTKTYTSDLQSDVGRTRQQIRTRHHKPCTLLPLAAV